MTGNLDMMMKFRDLRVAEAIGKKAALGWFDVEFTVYGCAYLDRQINKMCYRVSEQKEDIYDFVVKSAREDIFPSNVHCLTKKYPVPSGMRELIAQDVKQDLAKQLQALYPKAFFQKLYQLAEFCTTDQMKSLLWAEAEHLEGMFAESALQDFFELLQYSYSCRKLTRDTYEALLRWYQEEMRNLDDNFVSKDIFETTMYAVGYESGSAIRYKTNANRGELLAKAFQMEQEGAFVTPVIFKTYWYNYQYRLSDVNQDFRQYLQQQYQDVYIHKIREIRKKSEKGNDVFDALLQETKTVWGEAATQTLVRYGYHWCLV